MINLILSETTKKLGIQIPSILFPNKEVNLQKWSVVACDQYTSQIEYWKEVEIIAGKNPSTLNIIFPEVYLEDGNEQNKIDTINKNMKKYLEDKVLEKQEPALIYVDRQTSHAKSRKGLIIALDLEKYDYNKGSQTLIRATEGTVIERLPPRIKIRENAPIELPHIMVLIDDPDRTVIEPLSKKTDKLEKLYDFELMMNGGHIIGYKVEDSELLNDLINSTDKLSDPELFKSKYSCGDDKGILLFAVGDGNHSLAAAKGHWENVKKTLSNEDIATHPARFALVEVVNVHDEGLEFEPIHRVVFNIHAEEMLEDMVKFYNKSGSNAGYKLFNNKAAMSNELELQRKNEKYHVFAFITKESYGVFSIENPKFTLEVGTLQNFLDEYIKTNINMKIDYIHGEEVVTSLGTETRNMGFYLPSMSKHDLFKTVILDGVLPRKTFSMGEAEEKRFYLECRNICKD